MFRQRAIPKVTFATCVWEKDWRPILLDSEYLRVKQIENHCFPFIERLLIINNVLDLETVKRAAQKRVDEGVLTRIVIAQDSAAEVFEFFQLKKSDFVPEGNISPEWLYYNALGPLTALYMCASDYLLYMTGDVRLDSPVSWIEKAIARMERVAKYKEAN